MPGAINPTVHTAALAGLRDPDCRRSARAELDLAEGDLCGVTAASLHARKGHDVLLRALGAV